MEKFYTSRKVAELLGVHVKTVQVWDRKGVLKSYRTPTNRRYYKESQITDFLKLQGNDLADE